MIIPGKAVTINEKYMGFTKSLLNTQSRVMLLMRAETATTGTTVLIPRIGANEITMMSAPANPLTV